MLSSNTLLNIIEPTAIFQGVIVIVAPHMDDAVLACGGTIARLPQKDKIHIIYATDGSQSPKSILPSQNKLSKDLTTIRMQEAKKALEILGVSDQNLHFFNFPDGKLKNYSREFSNSLISLLEKVGANYVFIPFQYDSHTDHLAVNRLTTKAIQHNAIEVKLCEYFVYYNFRMLPGGDMRKYINPKLLYRVEICNESAKKRNALLCFRSQVTKFYDWQERPILSQAIIDDVCENQELFFFGNNQNLTARQNPFIGYRKYIPIIHFLEPALKKIKDKIIATVKTIKSSIGLISDKNNR